MFNQFLVKLIQRIIKIIFSYISWQSNEMFVNPIVGALLSTSLFVAVICLFL